MAIYSVMLFSLPLQSLLLLKCSFLSSEAISLQKLHIVSGWISIFLEEEKTKFISNYR